MVTFRNKRKLVTVSRKAPENTTINQSQKALEPGITAENINQVADEIEGKATRKLSKMISGTESRNLGALYKIDEFLLNPQVRICFVAVPGTSRNTNSANGEPSVDRFLKNHCPEV